MNYPEGENMFSLLDPQGEHHDTMAHVFASTPAVDPTAEALMAFVGETCDLAVQIARGLSVQFDNQDNALTILKKVAAHVAANNPS